MTFNEFHAEVTRPYIMQLIWHRGPQKDESKSFEVTPKTPEIQLTDHFLRDSNFYNDGKGGFQEKICKVELQY